MEILKTSPTNRTTVRITLIMLTLVVLLWTQFLPLEKQMQDAGYGIVDYELAFTPDKVITLLQTWEVEGRAAARLSLGIDFLFIPAYALSFAGITLIIARKQRGWLESAGLRLTLAPLIAGALDVLENVMLLAMLGRNDPTVIMPMTAGISATIKFLLLGATIIYWPIGGMIWSMRKTQASQEA